MSKKDLSEINIIYDINGEKEIKIFGVIFVQNNKNICKMIIDDKDYELTNIYKIQRNNNNKLKIKLKGINNITNLSCMFYGCTSLSSLPDISKWNTNNVTDMSFMFYNCTSLSSLPDISKWNSNNVTDMIFMFDECPNIVFSKVIKTKFNL